jgi:4-amino-4-deoxy-L-arabinose transferase-like glycosyltransferase
MSKSQKILLLAIVLTAAVLRFYYLSKVPSGLLADETAQGLNAFSILKTGKDMYGKSFPILFRANGSYQPPLYAYLTIIPTLIWGNSIFTARFISALAGVSLVVIMYLLLSSFGVGNKRERAAAGLMASAVVAISPWAIYFSREAVEANLGVLALVLGVYLLLLSLNRIRIFPIACMVLAISTHAYYSERVVAILALGLFVLINWRVFLKEKKLTALGLGIFVLILLPHLYLLTTGALTKRLSQVSYLNDVGQKMGLTDSVVLITKQFVNHYLIYFSPKNLFFDPGSSLGRTSPDLGVLYPWMIVFFFAGLGYLFKNRGKIFPKVLLILLVVAPIPAGLTGDLFYPLRVLDYLWVVSVIVSLGCFQLWAIIKNKWIKTFVFLGLTGYSLAIFGLSYFVLFKYDSATDFGQYYIDLIQILNRHPNEKIIVDANNRAWGAGIRATYLGSVDPKIVQSNLGSQLKSAYYSSEVNWQESFSVGNVSYETLNWNEVCGDNLIIVGDILSIGPENIKEHELDQLFTVPDYLDQSVIFGYTTRRLCN